MTVRDYRDIFCENAYGNSENFVRIARDFRAGSQKYGGIRFSKIGSPRKSPRPIPQYFIVYGSPSAYIEKENPSNEGYFSINVTR
jgi:hypothetical protein